MVSRPAYDALVVGAGPNGLAAAVRLAQAGRSVLVIEAADQIGGGTRSLELTLPGFVHDVCSAIHPLAASSPFFSSLPLAEHGLTWVHPDVPLAHPLDDQPAGVLHRGLDVTADSLGDDAARWRQVFRPLVEHWDELVAMVLGPLVGIPRHPLVLGRFAAAALVPGSLLLRVFDTPQARALFAGCAAHAILPLSRPLTASFGLVLTAAGHAVGWPLARTGSQTIADALAAHLRSMGGEIETGREVRALADLPSSRAVLFDLAPRQVADIAGDALPERYRHRLRRFRHGPGSFKVDYALSEPVPWLDAACRGAGTVHLGGTADEVAAAESEVSRGQHPDRPYVLVAQQSLWDSSRAPQGRHTLWAYCHVPNGSTVDMTPAIEAQLERFAPGFHDVVLARHVAGPAWLEQHDAAFIGGDIAGGAHSGLQLFFRPLAQVRPYVTPNPALFLCSASTPPGAGVHGMCGFHAAEAALASSLRGPRP